MAGGGFQILGGGFLHRTPSGGAAYDDTAVLAAIAALQADAQWNVNAAAAGSDAGPSASVLVSSLSATKRSRVLMLWTQSGANNTTGIEFEPSDNIDVGDASWYRASNAGSFGEDTAKSTFGHVILNTQIVRVELIIDPVNKMGWAMTAAGAGASPGSSPRAEHTFMQWTTAAITSFRATQLGASATMTGTSWKVWTENT